MTDSSGNGLDKILQKLEQLEQQISAVNDRVARMEAGGERPAESPTSPETPPATVPVSPEAPTPPPAPEPASPAPAPPPLPPQTFPAPALPTLEVPPAPPPQPEPKLTAPPYSPARPPSYRPRPKRSGESLEMQVAQTWLPRIGVLVLALVLILFAREHVQGPVGKVVASYLLSLGLMAAGLFYQRRYPKWGGPVLAGGLAFSYFATYAMGFVEPMRLLDSLPLKLLLLGANLLLIFGFAHWKKSELTAGIALVLGYLTTGSVGSAQAGLISCMALSVLAVVFLWINRWFVATAVAAAASYLSWLYISRTMPPLAASAPALFWYQFLFLSLLFVIFLTASWVMYGLGRPAPDGLENAGEESGGGRFANMLRDLTATNVTAFFGGLVFLLYSTDVYWARAWMFFFPLATVLAGLGMLFRRARAVQTTYAVAAALTLAFAFVSVASAAWMPIFLSVQAFAMLAVARRHRSGAAELWSAVSLMILIYAGSSVMTDQGVSLAAYNDYRTRWMLPWWVHAAVGGITVAYAMACEKWRAQTASTRVVWMAVAYIAGVAGARIWLAGRLGLSTPGTALFSLSLVPLLGYAAVWAHSKVPSVALILAAFSSFLLMAEQMFNPGSLWVVAAGWAIAVAAVGAGLAVERRGVGSPFAERAMWRTLYVWAQLVACFLVARFTAEGLTLPVLAVVFAGTLGLAWAVRSGAIGKSGFVTLLIIALVAIPQAVRRIEWAGPICAVVLVVAAWPLGLRLWQARTGATGTQFTSWYQGTALFVAGMVLIQSATAQDLSDSLVFWFGLWALVAAVFAASRLFPAGVVVSGIYAVLAALMLSAQYLGNFLQEEAGRYDSAWALAGVAALVAAERVIHHAPALSRIVGRALEPVARWPRERTLRGMTIWYAIGTLAMAMVALRLTPELRVFYFTGAMVAAAFVWIVLGFWFREAVYRQAGLTVLCFGFIKALVWDVLSLKNAVYRQISWTILGVLAIVASFLYNRFRGRVDQRPAGE